MSRGNGNARLARLEAKLERYINEGKLYEAEQMYQTLCSRYCAQSKFEEASQLAKGGSIRLLGHKHAATGAKLAMELIHAFEKSNQQVQPHMIDDIAEVFAAFPEDASMNKITFMKKAIKWTVAKGSYKAGDPTLHLKFSQHYRSLKDFGNAAMHLLHSHSYEEHAKFLIEWANRGYPSERDLFITRCVLQYLCVQNLEGAIKVFDAFMKEYPFLDTPLINFCRFLLRALERDTMQLYQMLRSKYEPSLKRDQELVTYVDRIGKLYFDLKPAGQGMSGLFGELLEMLEEPSNA